MSNAAAGGQVPAARRAGGALRRPLIPQCPRLVAEQAAQGKGAKAACRQGTGPIPGSSSRLGGICCQKIRGVAGTENIRQAGHLWSVLHRVLRAALEAHHQGLCPSGSGLVGVGNLLPTHGKPEPAVGARTQFRHGCSATVSFCAWGSGVEQVGPQPMGLASVPMPSMVIQTSSPLCRVNSSPGTMPVPVMSKAPVGKVLSR